MQPGVGGPLPVLTALPVEAGSGGMWTRTSQSRQGGGGGSSVRCSEAAGERGGAWPRWVGDGMTDGQAEGGREGWVSRWVGEEGLSALDRAEQMAHRPTSVLWGHNSHP